MGKDGGNGGTASADFSQLWYFFLLTWFLPFLCAILWHFCSYLHNFESFLHIFCVLIFQAQSFASKFFLEVFSISGRGVRSFKIDGLKCQQAFWHFPLHVIPNCKISISNNPKNLRDTLKKNQLAFNIVKFS